MSLTAPACVHTLMSATAPQDNGQQPGAHQQVASEAPRHPPTGEDSSHNGAGAEPVAGNGRHDHNSRRDHHGPAPATPATGDVLVSQRREELRFSERVLQRALAAASNGIIITDATTPEQGLMFVNSGFERITGYRAQEVLGRNCRFLQGPDSDAETVAVMRRAIAEGRECRVTVRNYRKDGTPFWNEVFLSPVRRDGRVVQFIGVQNDVSERRHAEDRVAHLAYHDALTGLANRRRLGELLDQAVERGRRQGLSVALMYLDLDNFKAVNDTLGHAAGDELLRLVAQRLADTVRVGDTLVRQGGDEFLLLLPDIGEDPVLAARTAAERIEQALRAPLRVNGAAVQTSASMGVSIFPRDAPDTTSLLAQADSAMYQAKASGRARLSLYAAADRADHPQRSQPPRAERAGADLSLEAILAAGAIRPLFQPVVDLRSGAHVAYEALARGPLGSALERPDMLFETARRAGRLGELDWTCRVAALDAAEEAGLHEPLSLLVNVEPEALHVACPEHLQPSWARAERQRHVILEITERSLTARPTELLRAVGEMRERGWGIALDDIGADVRSLALMPLLSPDVLKLDLRLIHERPTTEIAAIVNAVNAHRERTGAQLVAEGIETPEHLAAALGMGATLGQGWLFGRPGPLPATLPWVPQLLGRAIHPGLGIAGATPYEVVRSRLTATKATKPLLLAISMHFEQQAQALGPEAVVLSAFQTAERFTPATRLRYADLAQRAALVAALGVNLDAAATPGVRGAHIGLGDPLTDEWSVVVVGPHFAGALVALDLGDDCPEDQRRFDYAVTYDRDLVLKAAASLLARVEPAPRTLAEQLV